MATSAADLQMIIQWGLASDQRAVADAMYELVSEDLRPRLPRITAPTLLLGTWIGLHEQLEKGGIELSRASVVKTFEDQYAGLPRMHFAITDAARHFIMLDQPAWFFQQLDEFLANPAKAIDDRGFAR
jgi:pimeloyl-ACP methyl ester carboxylesterase